MIGKINSFNTNLSFGSLKPSKMRKLIPASEYKGPTLQLSKKDSIIIHTLKKKQAVLLKEIEQFEIQLDNKFLTPQLRTQITAELQKYKDALEHTNNSIKYVKSSRFEVQKNGNTDFDKQSRAGIVYSTYSDEVHGQYTLPKLEEK